MKNETQKSYHLDPAKLTPEQRDKLENYKMVKEQNQSLADIADMMQELLDVADTGNKNTGQLKALGAILTDAREQLVEMNKKEAPEAPDYGKPIVEAIGKLEKAVQAQETKPQVNVASPNVHVDAPDLTEFSNILRKEMPKAFAEAIKLIPKTDVVIPEAPDRWDEVLEKLESIDTASRMKPQAPNTVKVTNPDGSSIGSVSGSTVYITILRAKAADPETTYIGKAVPGSLTSQAVWQIASLDENTNLDLLYADGGAFTQVYDDREALTYA